VVRVSKETDYRSAPAPRASRAGYEISKYWGKQRGVHLIPGPFQTRVERVEGALVGGSAEPELLYAIPGVRSFGD